MEENLILLCVVTALSITWIALERRQTNKIPSRNAQNNTTKTISLKNTKWFYRNEGNGYLSISLPETRKILRLKKSPIPNGLREKFVFFLYKFSRLSKYVEEKAMIEELANLEYYKLFIYLLGECYVQPAQDVLIDKEYIWKINEKIQSLRPNNRKMKHISYTCGSLLADYACLPVTWGLNDTEPIYSVEIKPKHGWIAKNELTLPMCTYCLNQYIKLQNNEITEISNYCPFDFFSGCESRIKFAIKNLLDAPQNNFKIFKNGKLIYGDTVNKNMKTNILASIFDIPQDYYFDSTEEFCDLLTKALLRNLMTSDDKLQFSNKNSEIKTKETDVGKVKLCVFEDNLPKGCVLDRILNIQKLDQFGAEDILQKINSLNIKNEDLNRVKTLSLNGSDAISTINQYLMSAVAKDCSLMIAFKKLNERNKVPEPYVLTTDSEFKYAFQIGVFDLYPKKIKTVEKHFNKRKLLIEAYHKLRFS